MKVVVQTDRRVKAELKSILKRKGASACCKINAICASVNFDFFMEPSSSRHQDHNWKIPAENGPNYGKQVITRIIIGKFQLKMVRITGSRSVPCPDNNLTEKTGRMSEEWGVEHFFQF
jgi:hypothetical protein